MRIVGGALKGRAIKGPKAEGIRPTSDRLRETLFNILEHGHEGAPQDARVIDLFAGTGAFGLEALSRGGKFCLFVDDGAQARALIRENVELLGLGGVTKIFRRDARKLGVMPPGEAYDLAFLDPPYHRGLAEPALTSLRMGGWLKSGALVIVEEAAAAMFEPAPGFELLERRDYGDTEVIFLRAEPTEPA